MTIRRSRARASSSPACYLAEFESAARAAHPRGIQIKRVYDPPHAADGFRVLADRLWPRGVSRERAALDAWLVELAPSTALRQWFHRDPGRWAEFARRYRAELRSHTAALQGLRKRAAQGRVTLLYAARDARINHAVILRAVLMRAPPGKPRSPRPRASSRRVS